jgi:hypothetical protein
MKQGKYACITVSDTGTGIDQSMIYKIFDPYFTTKELGKGTGLGLSVVHGIVKEHGGDIRVYSEIGKGTTFNVYLPLLEDAKDSKSATVTRKYPTGSESILLVDDEEPIVLLEQMMLEKLGYQITVRTSSPDALAAFKANPGNFDLVISDRGMANMTGDQLAEELILSAAAGKCTRSGGLKMRIKNRSKNSHWSPLSGSSDRWITPAESFRFRLFPSCDSFCPQ